MCKAINKTGKRCRIKSSSLYCHIHTLDCDRYVPTIEEQREEMIQKIINNSIQSQFQLWPLFEGMDLTSEAITIVKRAKYVCDLSDETVDMLISNCLTDEINYNIIRDAISSSGKVTDTLSSLRRVELIKDTVLLCIKLALSRGEYWQGMELARRIYLYNILPAREKYINKLREEGINKLRLNELKKVNVVCDDVCNYIIAKYL